MNFGKTHYAKVIIIFFIASFLFSLLPDLTHSENIRAPDFSLKDLKGKVVSLSDFRGKGKVLLFFWATWCPHCQSALKKLKGGPPQKYTLLTINISEPRERIERFFKSQGYDFKVLLDEEGDVAFSYGIIGIPAYIIIDSNLSIIYADNIFPSEFN